MRDSFIFYRSFYKCIKALPMRSRDALFMAICEYACDGKEPELSELEDGIFSLMKPQIDANNKRYENGKQGGRPKKEISNFEESSENENQTETSGFENNKPNKNQTETKGFENNKKNKNQTETKPKPNVNVNDNVNDNDNVNANDNTDSQHTHKRGKRFDEFWKVYPRKLDMLNTQGEYMHLLETTESLSEEDLLAAARNYAESCQIQNTKERYIKIATNWLRESAWIDYLPENYKKPEVIKKSSCAQKTNRNSFNNFQTRDYQFSDLERELLAAQ